MKTKNIFLRNILFLGTVIAFSSCSFLDLSDPDDLTAKDFYKTEKEMDQALNAAYDGLTTNYYNNMYYWTEIRSDNTTLSSKTANSGIYNDFDVYNLTSANAEVQRAWYGMFTCIVRSNAVLDHINDAPMTDKSRSQIEAQALFLRALSYYNLSQLFGEVPIVKKQITTESIALAHGRMPLDEVYTFITEDLKAVTESELPDNWGFDAASPNFGRASKTAGYALLGKVYLTMAKRLNDGKSEEYLKLAEEALLEAYKLKTFGTLNEIAYAKIFGVANKNNPEIIFQVLYLQGTDKGSSFAKSFQPYKATGLISQSEGGGNNMPESDLMDSYENGDMRKVISYRMHGSIPYVYKYSDLGDSQGRGGSCWIVLRYADVILMLSETYEAMGNEGESVKYLNMVRERAKLKVHDPAKKPNLKDAIMEERRIELAFENHRWFDLVRFYSPLDLIQLLNSKSSQGFAKRDLLLPIPYREVKINPSKMYQNPDY